MRRRSEKRKRVQWSDEAEEEDEDGGAPGIRGLEVEVVIPLEDVWEEREELKKSRGMSSASRES